MNETLKIKMLGDFSVQYNEREIVLDRNIMSKTTQMMLLLILHKETGVAKASLIDALYGREDVENRNGSLNNTIFRLRKQLLGSGLPKDNYITITGGMCYWTGKIPVEVDCLEFENRIEAGDQTDDPVEKIELYEQACHIYTGEFLPDMTGEDWVAVQNFKDHELYIRCMQVLLEHYQKEEMYEKVNRIAMRAEEIYPFDDWQIYHIDGLIAMGRYEEAMALYEKTEKLFFEELGIAPSKEIIKRFHCMGERMSQAEAALDDIRQRLRERSCKRGILLQLSELVAPDGYKPGSEVTITVDDEGGISIESEMDGEADFDEDEDGILDYINYPETTITPTATPSAKTASTGNQTTYRTSVKTGDDTPIALYILLLAVAACAAGGAVTVSRKKRKNK